MTFEGLAYTHTPHDRAGSRRDDPDWVGTQLARPDAQIIPIWRNRCLIRAGRPVVLDGRDGAAVRTAASQTVLLGLDEAAPVFAVDVGGQDEEAVLSMANAEGSADLRSLAALSPHSLTATLAYARGLLYWHRHARFCGSCGSATRSAQAGHVRQCTGPDCARQLFPRIEPAVIVLVEAPGPEPRCLLARHRGAGPDGFALIAGFVEVGESLEGAVRREVAEEAGVKIGSVAYRASQGWPFPAGLMVGFGAQAVDDSIAVDGSELVEARWFSRAEVRERLAGGPGSGPVDSIGGHLLREWAAR
ncbi:NAD(+) diphosphatase [Actinoplanes aureus]|uniref:NAD(+) diphosphatase n=1 Tax=Actinoplanes aureus TaxID=2792083 RepID=A0A931C679_9ACTN|nr:NAD(+) diphosphatase [Actinoplanes aureus]MBG0561382.1 NAD(+) diphosphatase [Actinoplanes aureus]